jgi:hypothetical protein
VRSRHRPAAPGTRACPAELALDTHLAGHVRDLIGEGGERVDHPLIVSASAAISPLASTVSLRLRSPVGDRRHDAARCRALDSEVVRHHVDVVGQVLPGARDAAHLRLAAELAFRAHLARHARDFRGEALSWSTIVLMVDFSSKDLARTSTVISRQVAVGHRRRHLGDVAHLAGQVRGHHVDVVGEVLPGARDTFDLRLPAELALDADLARHANHLGGEALSWSTIVLMVFFSSESRLRPRR